MAKGLDDEIAADIPQDADEDDDVEQRCEQSSRHLTDASVEAEHILGDSGIQGFDPRSARNGVGGSDGSSTSDRSDAESAKFAIFRRHAVRQHRYQDAHAYEQ